MADLRTVNDGEPLGPLPLSVVAKRAYQRLVDLTARAKPLCPTCAGVGWTTRRVEFGFAGVETQPCHCTVEAQNA